MLDLKNISFWQRLFSWQRIIDLIENSFKTQNNTIFETKTINQVLQNKNIELEKRISHLEKEKEERQNKYDERFERLMSMEEELKNRRQMLEENEQEKIKQKFEKMKETWQKHETQTEEEIRRIANKYTIEYLNKDSLPFPKIKPDNTLKIAGEYVLFDAKSPYNDDLSNFPVYIKNQVEQAKKYAKLDGIKKDLFLVVPTNTIENVNQTFFNVSDYNVFIITKDSLEPIIVSLQKIEEYEFAEKLAPEDRDAICRIIGRFAHTTKRRLQIDNFFAREFIRLWQDSDILPTDILEKALDYEKGYKLNPEQEKRANQIDLKKLIEDTDKIEKEAALQNLHLGE